MLPGEAVDKDRFRWPEPAQNWPLLQQLGQRCLPESELLTKMFTLKALCHTWWLIENRKNEKFTLKTKLSVLSC